MAENIRQGFYGDEDRLEAANPYGCNQYGEGWKMPHNEKQSKKGDAVKKDSKNKWDTVTLDGSYVDYYSPKSYIVRKTRNGKGVYVPAKLCKFDGEKCVISVPPDSDLSDKLKKFADETEDTHKAVDLDDKVKESIWKHINDREEAGEDFDGFEEFDRIYDAHREEREEKYWEANRKALDDGASYSEASSRARKARQKADEDFLRDFAENLQAASAENCEEVEAGHKLGCNQFKCFTGCNKGTTRESKLKNANNTPKLAPADADTNEKEKALRDGIAWVLKNRKPLYEVCYVKSVNENGKEELVPLDLHVEDIEHAMEHKDIAKELWKTIGRGEWTIRDTETDEVYRIGRKKVVLRDYTKNGEKRKKIVTHYIDEHKDKKKK